MLFKKLGFFSLSILLIVLITACSSNPSSTNTSPDNTPATPTPAVFGSTIPQESLDQAMQICNGEGNSDFSSYTGIPGHHPLIVVGSDGSLPEWSDVLPVEWEPENPESSELVACIGSQTEKIIQLCPYVDGTPITRYAQIVDATIRDAKTGKVISSTIIYGDAPRACMETEDASISSLTGEPVPVERIIAYLTKMVEPLDVLEVPHGIIGFYSEVDDQPGLFVLDSSSEDIIPITNNPSLYPPTDFSISPDGNKVAYIVRRDDVSDCTYYPVGDIFTTSLNNFEEPVQLTTNGKNANVSWSPNGNFLAFETYDNCESSEIALLNLQDNTIQQITNNEMNARFPSWSPDESKLVFIQSQDGWYNKIYITNVDGTNQYMLSSEFEDQNSWGPSFSHDGSKIAYCSGNIFIMNTDGTNIMQLTNIEEAGTIDQPIWSIDDQTIYFQFVPDWTDYDDYKPSLRAINIDGSNELTFLQLTYVESLFIYP